MNPHPDLSSFDYRIPQQTAVNVVTFRLLAIASDRVPSSCDFDSPPSSQISSSKQIFVSHSAFWPIPFLSPLHGFRIYSGSIDTLALHPGRSNGGTTALSLSQHFIQSGAVLVIQKSIFFGRRG
ncbi:hypothetical protein C4D60_Mb04t02410 [Musa balbisiana]|uniref:Uncharacterized protein n=1 Tax=Musa balbisiana TaxID=52838 RepID=A0A4S8K932_MUSBA|nr:hypothetical protein C4D60_Mb04t02410 [Musa balbisiana]